MSVSQALSTSPARIFLSYKRHVDPDQALAQELVAGLSGAGHAVFIDQRLTVGQAWAREIEAQVRDSHFLIVFLTADSSRSEMVRGEIEIARHHAAAHSRRTSCRSGWQFDGALPYPLNAYLDSIQYAMWNGPQDTPRLLKELLAAMQRPRRSPTPVRRRRSRCAGRRRRTPRRCPSPAARSTSTIPGICRGRPTPRRSASSANRARR